MAVIGFILLCFIVAAVASMKIYVRDSPYKMSPFRS